MATENRRLESTFKAAEDLSSRQYFAIALNDNKLANSAAEASGILLTKPESGQFGAFGYVGEMKYRAGGAVSAGNKLTVTTSGYFVVADSGDFDAEVGEAKAAVTSGSIGTGIFSFASVAPQNDFWTYEVTPKCNLVAGIAYALDDSLVANNGEETDGVALAAMTSGTAANMSIGGQVSLRVADTTSAGDPLTVTTSGYFAVADSGDYVVGKALINTASGTLGASLFMPINAGYWAI